MDTQVLEEMGLSAKEVSTYTALLRLGPSPVTKVAEYTGIDRTLCYSLLNKLIDKGYVGYITDKQSKKFSATDPIKLLTDLEIQKEKLEQLIPELEKLKGKRTEPFSIEIFRGKEGPRWMFSDFMTQKNDAYIYGDLQYEFVARLQLEKYFKYLKEHDLYEYLIIPKGETPKVIPKHSIVRIIPRHLLSPSAVWVYGDTTTITIWSDPITTIAIKNKEVTNSYRNYFKFLWEKIGKKEKVIYSKPRK